MRDRDTMLQERVKIEDLKAYFEKKLESNIFIRKINFLLW